MLRWAIITGASVLGSIVVLMLWAGHEKKEAERAAVVAESRARLATLSPGKPQVAAPTPVPASTNEEHDGTPQLSERERDRETFASLQPAQRVSTMKKLCAPGQCERARVWRIVDSAGDESEKKRLNLLAERLVAADQAADQRAEATRGIAARAHAAEAFDAELLSKGLNPDGVEAIGATRSTLLVRGWFCSRQFIHDLQRNFSSGFKQAGFEKVECRSPMETWSVDL